MNETNAGDVARICRALDGMPLAIELAAARLRSLSAAQLAERLDARFELLTGGSRTVPRHETLRAVVDWTWELLSGPEQILAGRLAVFPAGATLAAAEQVCQDGALPAEGVLPAIFGLVEKSFLTVAEDDEPRYRMLETIRAYCAERLAESGEEDQVRLAFARYFLRLAETGDPMLRSAGQQTWMRRLTAEQDNMHAALHWVVDRRDEALALRFGQSLSWFWLLRGQRREGRHDGQGDPGDQHACIRYRARHRRGARPGRLRVDHGQLLLGRHRGQRATRGRGVPDHRGDRLRRRGGR